MAKRAPGRATRRGVLSSLRGPQPQAYAPYFCGPAGEAAGEAGELTGDDAGASLAAGDGWSAGVGVASGAVDCKTE